MIRRRLLLLSAPAIIGAAAARAADAPRLSMGTSLQGGSFTIYASAFAAMMKTLDPTLELRLVETRGTPENVARLQKGELELGLVTGEVAHEVLDKADAPRGGQLKVITALFPVPGMFAVPADSRYRSITDLKGASVVWNGRDSGLAVQARYVLNGLGLDPDKDFEAIYTEQLTEGPDLVIDRKAAALWGGGLRWPGFVKIAQSPRGAHFVAPTAEEIVRIRTVHPFLMPLSVPERLYRGQASAIDTVGSWSFMLAREDLREEVGYRLAADLMKGEQTGQISKQLAQTTAKNTIAAIASPEQLHAGVRRFYREQGLLR